MSDTATSGSDSPSTASSNNGNCDTTEDDIKPKPTKSVKILEDNQAAAGSGVPSKKKSVSFKTTLETSDDKTVVKKVYNPDNAPLVPIIKRKCLNRLNGLGKSTCIVRPSRLTDVLKNNENSTIIKASLFSSLPSTSTLSQCGDIAAANEITGKDGGDRVSGLSSTKMLESSRKSLLSCRIIKSSKKSLAGYPRELLKKIRKSIDGKASLSSRHIQFFNGNDSAMVANDFNNQDSGQGKCILFRFIFVVY